MIPGITASTRIQPVVLIPGLVSRLDFTTMPDGATFTDNAGKPWTSVGAAAVSGGKLVVAGGSYLTSPNHSDWDIGADEYCVEAIVTMQAFAERPLFGKWSSNADVLSYFFGFYPWGTQICRFNIPGNGQVTVPADAVPLNVPIHLAWFRTAPNGFIGMGLNGTVYGSNSYTAAYRTSNAAVTIGARDDMPGGLSMHVHQFRVRRGPGTSYPLVASFTPPSSL